MTFSLPKDNNEQKFPQMHHPYALQITIYHYCVTLTDASEGSQYKMPTQIHCCICQFNNMEITSNSCIVFLDALNHLDNSNDVYLRGVTIMWVAGKHCNNTPITCTGQWHGKAHIIGNANYHVCYDVHYYWSLHTTLLWYQCFLNNPLNTRSQYYNSNRT